MKKFTALFLTVIMVSSLIYSCGTNDIESTATTDTSEPAEETESEKSYYETLGVRDFEGVDFTILTSNRDGAWLNIPSEERIGEVRNDAHLQRDQLIEEMYNVNINYISTEFGNLATTFRNDVMAGDNSYDMVICRLRQDLANMTDLLYNIADMSYLSLDSPWWCKQVSENVTIGGNLFYTTGDIAPGIYQAVGCMYINLRLAENYGINKQGLYDLVFNNKWTLDELEKIVKDKDIDLNNDGEIHADDDFYGIVYQSRDYTVAGQFTIGAGLKLSEINGDEVFVNLDNQYSMARIDRLMDFLVSIDYTDHNDPVNKTYMEGRALFVPQFLNYAISRFRDMDDDYGILPMPKYDEMQESYHNAMNASYACFVASPINIKDPDMVAFMLESMAYTSYDIMRPSVYEATIKAKGARDLESERIIDLLVETSYVDLNYIYDFGGSLEALRQAIIDKSPFISAFEAKKSSIEQAIEKLLASTPK